MTLADRADWDTSVLDSPVIVDVPDQLPARADALVVGAGEAVAAQRAGDRARADLWLERLAHSGVVAVRTSTAVLEVREVVDGWRLVGCHGTPDPADLAAAARLRALRLAAERRQADDRSDGAS